MTMQANYVTFGEKGAKGDKGDPGDAGPPGPPAPPDGELGDLLASDGDGGLVWFRSALGSLDEQGNVDAPNLHTLTGPFHRETTLGFQAFGAGSTNLITLRLGTTVAQAARTFVFELYGTSSDRTKIQRIDGARAIANVAGNPGIATIPSDVVHDPGTLGATIAWTPLLISGVYYLQGAVTVAASGRYVVGLRELF